MKIIYHCFGGSHSSVTAASLHLKLLKNERLPSYEEMMQLPYYDKTNNNDFGSIRFMGIDEFGNEVYVLGKKSLGDRFTNILNGVAEILGNKNEIMVVNTMSRVNALMKIGGFISRRLNIIFIGRPLVIYGTRKSFFYLVNLVEITKLKALK